ncbi:MAG: glycosyltransferase [Ignavibacteria bacterium]|nr:glycosyltransferase [Ignavibacteria bacterium]
MFQSCVPDKTNQGHFAKRYPEIPNSKWVVIENGYDEDNFLDAETGLELLPLGNQDQLTLIHSGTLYPEERDPRAFFQALSNLKVAGEISAEKLQIVLRATGSDALYQPKLIALNLQDIVRLEPVIAYRDALREMLRADGLLLFQEAYAIIRCQQKSMSIFVLPDRFLH